MRQSQESLNPAERNVRLLAALERSDRRQRGVVEQVIDQLGVWAGYPSFAVVHALWFGLWLAYNAWSPEPFDPYPPLIRASTGWPSGWPTPSETRRRAREHHGRGASVDQNNQVVDCRS